MFCWSCFDGNPTWEQDNREGLPEEAGILESWPLFYWTHLDAKRIQALGSSMQLAELLTEALREAWSDLDAAQKIEPEAKPTCKLSRVSLYCTDRFYCLLSRFQLFLFEASKQATTRRGSILTKSSVLPWVAEVSTSSNLRWKHPIYCWNHISTCEVARVNSRIQRLESKRSVPPATEAIFCS